MTVDSTRRDRLLVRMSAQQVCQPDPKRKQNDFQAEKTAAHDQVMNTHITKLFFSPYSRLIYLPEWTANEKDTCAQSNYFLAGNAKRERTNETKGIWGAKAKEIKAVGEVLLATQQAGQACLLMVSSPFSPKHFSFIPCFVCATRLKGTIIVACPLFSANLFGVLVK